MRGIAHLRELEQTDLIQFLALLLLPEAEAAAHITVGLERTVALVAGAQQGNLLLLALVVQETHHQ